MFTFSAVIYDGNKQSLVRYDGNDEEAFERYLNEKYACYVCLWSNKELSERAVTTIKSSVALNEAAKIKSE